MNLIQAEHVLADYMDEMDVEDQVTEQQLYAAFVFTETLFHKAVNEIFCIDEKLDQINIRIKRALKTENQVHVQLLRQEGVTYEGVRYYFYTYATRKAEELCEIRKLLFNEEVDIEEEYILVPEGYQWQLKE